MNFEEVNAYLQRMFFARDYKDLTTEDQQAVFFDASELLKDHFDESRLTPRIIGTQILFMLEGENEEYATLRRQGVTNMTAKDVSVTLGERNIAPDVLAVLSPEGTATGKASVSELI